MKALVVKLHEECGISYEQAEQAASSVKAYLLKNVPAYFGTELTKAFDGEAIDSKTLAKEAISDVIETYKGDFTADINLFTEKTRNEIEEWRKKMVEHL